MTYFDKQIDSSYINPYENEGLPIASCWICDEKIVEGENYYVVLSKNICRECIARSERIG